MAPAPVVSDPYGHPHPQDIRTPPHERMVVAVVPARRSSLLQPAGHRAGVVLGLFFLFLDHSDRLLVLAVQVGPARVVFDAFDH